eukprot:COSAG02_NODE_2028_length_10073_cov_24.819531_1_plen_37_part_00
MQVSEFFEPITGMFRRNIPWAEGVVDHDDRPEKDRH